MKNTTKKVDTVTTIKDTVVKEDLIKKLRLLYKDAISTLVIYKRPNSTISEQTYNYCMGKFSAYETVLKDLGVDTLKLYCDIYDEVYKELNNL